MTYWQFLLIFLGVPIVVLAILLRRVWTKPHSLALGLVCALAFFYTTPWDNYAAYRKLWTFGADFVGRIWIGYLPLEEYVFYFAEAIFVCLVMVALARVSWLRPHSKDEA